MKNRALKVGAAVLLFLAFGIIIWDAQQPTEPTYEGKPLSFWLHRYYLVRDSDDFHAPATREINAIRAIGTNGIPTLLRMLRKKDSPWRQRLLRLAERQHIVHVPFLLAYDQNREAMYAFELLGSTAKDATPAIVEILEANVSPSSQETAMWALRGIGPAASGAIPVLLQIAANPDTRSRINALVALGGIHSSNEVVVPALIGFLNGPDVLARRVAADSLAKYDTTEVIAALVQASTNADSGLRAGACTALGDTHAAPEVATRALRERLHDPDPAVRANAAAALNQIDPAPDREPADK